MRFFPREKGKMAFVEGFSLKRPRSPPFLRGEHRISRGVENRGSLISVPLALRVVVIKILYASWGPIVSPSLRSSARAPTIEAVRGTVAIKGVLDN